MRAIIADQTEATTNRAPIPCHEISPPFPDPLDIDEASDELVITTRRAIGRVALVATEAANRFYRESIPHDPMAWMFAPRQLFEGGSAVDACLSRDDCMRAILVHGLGLGLDVERAAIDVLLAAEEDEDSSDDQYIHPWFIQGHSEPDHVRKTPRNRSRLRLYTATIVDTRDNRMLQAFHASVARNIGEVQARLAGRFGCDIAEAADIRVGVHPASPLVVSLVPTPVLEMLKALAAESSRRKVRTFAIDIEQSIQA